MRLKLNHVLVRHNCDAPSYYPKCAFLYDFVAESLYEYSEEELIYVAILNIAPERLSEFVAAREIEGIVFCIDFTNVGVIARIDSSLPAVVFIGDTHHGPSSISRIRAAMLGREITAIVLLFTPCHALFFSDIANVFYLEGLCPTLGRILANTKRLRPVVERSKTLLLTGSVGDFHQRRKAIYEQMLCSSSILGHDVRYLPGSIDVAAKGYAENCLSINVPLSTDINQRHWEIIASGGTPLFLPALEIPYCRDMMYLRDFIPPSRCKSLKNKLEWAVDALGQLMTSAAKALDYLTRVDNEASDRIREIIMSDSPAAGGLSLAKWPKKPLNTSESESMRQLIQIVETAQCKAGLEDSETYVRALLLLDKHKPLPCDAV